ncbi:hypothetical protein J6590_037700 [Homalodisca vitripennis]|nr:hypothetical protein J6590_037700 [Homalodisca vitripennis]
MYNVLLRLNEKTHTAGPAFHSVKVCYKWKSSHLMIDYDPGSPCSDRVLVSVGSNQVLKRCLPPSSPLLLLTSLSTLPQPLRAEWLSPVYLIPSKGDLIKLTTTQNSSTRSYPSSFFHLFLRNDNAISPDENEFRSPLVDILDDKKNEEETHFILSFSQVSLVLTINLLRQPLTLK